MIRVLLTHKLNLFTYFVHIYACEIRVRTRMIYQVYTRYSSTPYFGPVSNPYLSYTDFSTNNILRIYIYVSFKSQALVSVRIIDCCICASTDIVATYRYLLRQSIIRACYTRVYHIVIARSSRTRQQKNAADNIVCK